MGLLPIPEAASSIRQSRRYANAIAGRLAPGGRCQLPSNRPNYLVTTIAPGGTLTWFVFGEGQRVLVEPGGTAVVGRDADCSLVLSGARVSRRHLEIDISQDGESWTLRDMSSRGVFGAVGRVSGLTGAEEVWLSLGSGDGPWIAISRAPFVDLDDSSRRPSIPSESTGSERAVERESRIKSLDGVVRIGRAPDNDLVIPGVLASSHHAHLLRGEHSLEIVDLASARGTYVNGARIGRAQLSTHDQVTIGGSTFIVSDTGSLDPTSLTEGVSLTAVDVTVRVGKDLQLLRQVSFALPPREVLAVVGPSGSGKSTLLGALTGFTPASSGDVLQGSRHLYREYDELRFQIGMVPQADLVQTQLKVRSALDYAARLRFPGDVKGKERSARVTEVLSDLGLDQRADLRIDRLSGGQRKRVSVALEMLTRPRLLFLDEPTSGLDPGLDRQVMMLLRELADSGRTVVVVTHAVENLALADKLLVLAAGGYVAYFGPPQDAPKYFGVPDMPSVFMALENAPGSEWRRRWDKYQSLDAGLTQDVTPGTPDSELNPTALRPARMRGAFSQFLTMTSRNLKVIVSDRTYSGLLLLLPIALAFTGFLVGNSSGLGPIPELGINPEARSLLLVLILGSVFTGAATSIQELVKDRVIYQRERAVGLSRVAYVASKATVLGIIALAQGAVFASLALAGRAGPIEPLVLPGNLEIIVLVCLATATSAMLGLVLSAFLPTRDSALPALVIATMIQVVFSGVVPLRFPAVLDAVGWAMPAYWEFRGMASSSDLGTLVGESAGSESWPHVAEQWWLSVGVLVVMIAVLIVTAVIACGRHDPGSRQR